MNSQNKITAILLTVSIIISSLILREKLFNIESLDFTIFLNNWLNFIRSHGTFNALQYNNFSNYNPPYLYLLAIGTLLTESNLLIIKSISICFDLIQALFVFLIIKQKYKNNIYVPITAGLIALLLPSIFLNSAAWGQCDAIYTTFALGAIYFILKKQYNWTCIFFGLSIAFKLQAIFLFPLLLILLITEKTPLKIFKSLILIPITYYISLIPAIHAGRPTNELLQIYSKQAESYKELTKNAPTILSWFPGNGDSIYYANAMIILTFATVLLISLLVIISQKKLTHNLYITLSLLFATIIPFLLPYMHERYFYMAEIISLIYAFYRPKFFIVPIIIQIPILITYIGYLTKTHTIPLFTLSFFILTACGIVIYDLIKQLFSKS